MGDGGLHAFSRYRQDMNKMRSHMARHCKEKSMVGCFDFLADRTGPISSSVDLAYRPGRSTTGPLNLKHIE